MRYGKFLPKGGTIGFIAPSFGCATEPYITEFDSAIDKFIKMGYSVDIGPNCSSDQGIGIVIHRRSAAKRSTNISLQKIMMYLYPAVAVNSCVRIFPL